MRWTRWKCRHRPRKTSRFPSESNSELISVNNDTGEATVTLPETTTRVTLTATATHGDAVAKKEFTVAVLSEDTMTEAYQIYPTPQSLTMTYETAPLTETVNVVYGSTIDEVTKARVEEVLSEHGMTISEDGAGEGLTQVLVGVNGSGEYFQGRLLDDGKPL